MIKVILIILLVGSFGAGAETKFISGTEDIPLMPRLQESDTSAQATFASPQGKILSTVMHGTVSPNEIFAYYDGTLPNLGWQKKDQGKYLREGETLTVKIKKYRNMISFVEFSLVSGTKNR
tara:strand:- start:47385 stop:47747 length:363 start_codon:yes stop_codon:yes gene_type:complete